MKKKVVMICLVLCLMVAMNGEVFAAGSVNQSKKATSKVSYINSKEGVKEKSNWTKPIGYSATDGDGSIFINKPEKNSVFYKGEKIHFDFSAYDTWEYVWAGPTVRLINVGSGKRYVEEDYEVVAEDSYDDYSGDIKTNRFPAGNYRFSVILYPYEYKNDDDPVYDYEDWDLPEASVYLTLKVLKAPRGLKVKAGKRKVTVSFRAARGATKYEIYKSNKKNRGFKRIKTTKARRFVDKKVKRGKKYYYKVKAVRSYRNTIKSSFSSVRRSGKVK